MSDMENKIPKENLEQEEPKDTQQLNSNKNEEDTLDELLQIDKQTSSVENIEEEIKEETQQQINEDIERCRIVLPTYSLDILERKLDEISSNIKNFRRNVEKFGSIENVLTRMINAISDQYIFLRDVLERNKDIEWNNTYIDEEKNIKIKDSVPKISKNFNGQKLSGKDAELFILAQNKNIKKIHLLNSGFYVVLRCPTLSELDMLYNSISDKISEYGRMFGTYFYLFNDLEIKRSFLDLIKTCVKSSNLKNWNKGNNLFRHISIHDYPVLLHGLASLMFKEGYEYRYICPYCDYNEVTNIDVNKLKYSYFSKIPTEGLEILSSSDVKTKTILEKYHSLLDLNKSYTVDNKYTIHLKCPSVFSYIEYGDDFNKTLMDVIQSGNQTLINEYLRFSYFKIFCPWIEKIDVLNEEGQVNFVVDDIEGKCIILDELQNNDRLSFETVIDPIVDFIKDSQLTSIAIPLNPCPKCNQIPEAAIKGFLPVDMQENFFIMSTMRLTQSFLAKSR